MASMGLGKCSVEIEPKNGVTRKQETHYIIRRLIVALFQILFIIKKKTKRFNVEIFFFNVLFKYL